MRSRMIACVLLLVVAGGAFAQVPGTSENLPPFRDEPAPASVPPALEPGGSGTPPAEEPVPEVPQWARDLRRAEIVATGSFPLTLLASRLVYSLLRFVVKSVQARAIDPAYAPWFLAPPGSPELEFSEKLGVLGGAGAFSMLIAFIDYRRGVAEVGESQ